ncbi:hypothetical protein JSY36_06395 [Bacillus sp. H-16]|uniref:hypothetical protein n=1 Tax=Alteribacter salitolerans TaxID=2912333 RepID=UPI001963D29A|nr:hypothetical protein [Alteribacter salitolerans]MBM7095381.1 hypothetical protein [Alteribacter salitolerans]
MDSGMMFDFKESVGRINEKRIIFRNREEDLRIKIFFLRDLSITFRNMQAVAERSFSETPL